MESWPWIPLAAAVAVLLIRLDAKLVGPYFALTNLVYGMEGRDARYWYESDTLRWAVARRFGYAIILGGILDVVGASQVQAGEAGLVAALLLLWPVVFHGLPQYASRRDWEVPALYVALAVAFTSLSVVGAFIVELMKNLGEGSLVTYVKSKLLENIPTFVLGILASAFFRGAFNSLRNKAAEREARQFHGDGAEVAEE